MKHVLLTAAVLTVGAVVAGCGGTMTSDTEGMTVASAQQTLGAEGVAASNIAVVGDNTPEATVCDHDPDGVEVSSPTTLYAAVGDCEQAMSPGGVLAAAVAAGTIKKHKVLKKATKAGTKKATKKAKKKKKY